MFMGFVLYILFSLLVQGSHPVSHPNITGLELGMLDILINLSTTTNTILLQMKPCVGLRLWSTPSKTDQCLKTRITVLMLVTQHLWVCVTQDTISNAMTSAQRDKHFTKPDFYMINYILVVLCLSKYSFKALNKMRHCEFYSEAVVCKRVHSVLWFV